MLERVNGWMTAEQLLGRVFDVELGFMRSRAKDSSPLAQAYHPQVVVHEPASLPYAGDWHGLDGVARLLRMMGQLWSEFRRDHMEAMRRGDTVFLSGTLHLQGRATGAAIDQPFAEVLHFKDDLLLDATPFYYDTGAVLSVLR
ncbi:MAG: nuclear transport factor 2 family protein [Alphaproteobacteria bacterium]